MTEVRVTNANLKVLEAIKDLYEEKGYPPTVREIGFKVGLSSPSSVHAHLLVLSKAGYIKRDESKPRALVIVDKPSSNKVHSHQAKET